MSTPTMHETMAALTAVGAAVSKDDREAYVEAVEAARAAGCSEWQLADAYKWRSSLRLKGMLTPVSFTAAGEPRRR